jgi:hypothetical protein
MTRARDVADTQDNLGGAVPPFVAGKNRIINGDCFYNQRGFSSQTLTTETGVFIVDRISGVNVISGSSTFSVQQFALGTAPVAGYEAKQYIRAVTTGQDSGFAGTIIGTTIEDVRTFANQTVTISFWAKAASGTPNVSFEFRQVFGTGGSPSDTVEGAGGVQKFAISTSWTRYSKTITLPSIAGKTLGSNNNSRVECNIWVSAGAGFNSRTNSLGIQSNTFDIWGLQVEAGSAATPFSLATGTFATELVACQRYYEKSYDIAIAPAAADANGSIGLSAGANNATSPYFTYSPVFQVRKRSTPSITVYDLAGNSGKVSKVSGSTLSMTDNQTATADRIGQYGFRIYATFSDAAGFYGHFTASAEY